MPKERDAQDEADDIFEEADKDESTDDLTRGTEIYEDEDMDYDEGHTDELDFEPDDYGRDGGSGSFEDDMEPGEDFDE